MIFMWRNQWNKVQRWEKDIIKIKIDWCVSYMIEVIILGLGFYLSISKKNRRWL